MGSPIHKCFNAIVIIASAIPRLSWVFGYMTRLLDLRATDSHKGKAMFGCRSEAFATHKMNDDALHDEEAHVFFYTEGVDCIEDIRQRQTSARWVVSMEISAKK